MLCGARSAQATTGEICSTVEALCVHDTRGDTSTLPARLEIAERTLGTLRIVGLPQPARRLSRGVVVIEDTAAPAPEAACEREARIVRAVVSASVAVAEAEPVSAAALTRVFAALASPCRSALDRADDERAARLPERGWPVQAPRLLGWLDRELGAAGPGQFLAAATTRLSRSDLFAVLRENSKDGFFSGSSFADAVAAFGLSQFLPLPAEPALAWDIEWPTQPRALLLPEPLAPLGSAAIRVRVPAGRHDNAPLRVEASWEQRAALRLAVVAVDEAGAELQKAWIPGRARVPEASFTFREVPGARALLLVLTSLGDPFVALDARQLSLEPHGAVVTLAEAE